MKVPIRLLPVLGARCTLCFMVALSGIAPPTARADAKAEALLAKVKAVYKSAVSYSTTVTITSSQGTHKSVQVSTVQLRKPNLASMHMSSPIKLSVVWDGKGFYELMGDNQYRRQPTYSDDVERVGQFVGLTGALFFGQDSFGFGKLSDAGMTRTYVGKEKVEGAEYEVVSVTASKPYSLSIKLYITSSGMIARASGRFSPPNKPVATQISEWRQQEFNAVPATAVALPKDAKILN